MLARLSGECKRKYWRDKGNLSLGRSIRSSLRPPFACEGPKDKPIEGNDSICIYDYGYFKQATLSWFIFI